MGLRTISAAVHSDRLVHRAERVPAWWLTPDAVPWRALCGVAVGKAGEDGAFEFHTDVAIDPKSWGLAANCPACLAVTEHRKLGSVG